MFPILILKVIFRNNKSILNGDETLHYIRFKGMQKRTLIDSEGHPQNFKVRDTIPHQQN